MKNNFKLCVRHYLKSTYIDSEFSGSYEEALTFLLKFRDKDCKIINSSLNEDQFLFDIDFMYEVYPVLMRLLRKKGKKLTEVLNLWFRAGKPYSNIENKLNLI
jgi:hypothetical protein